MRNIAAVAQPVSKWRFHVRGRLVAKGSGTPLADRDLVIESGVRDEASPFHATGVGPIAHSKADGAFESWFVTAGTDGRATVPQFVHVFLEVDEGKWAPLRIPLTEASGSQGSDAGLALDLGAIEVDEKELSR